jgi:hypothetical protein
MTRRDVKKAAKEAARSVAEPIRYDAYEVVVSLLDGEMIVRRQDPDRKRTVCFIETLAEWDRFVAALKSGAGEVAAVHAIDATEGQ